MKLSAEELDRVGWVINLDRSYIRIAGNWLCSNPKTRTFFERIFGKRVKSVIALKARTVSGPRPHRRHSKDVEQKSVLKVSVPNQKRLLTRSTLLDRTDRPHEAPSPSLRLSGHLNSRILQEKFAHQTICVHPGFS